MCTFLEDKIQNAVQFDKQTKTQVKLYFSCKNKRKKYCLLNVTTDSILSQKMTHKTWTRKSNHVKWLTFFIQKITQQLLSMKANYNRCLNEEVKTTPIDWLTNDDKTVNGHSISWYRSLDLWQDEGWLDETICLCYK